MAAALDKVKDLPTYVPPTVRNQHCGIPDWCRYSGAFITGIGIGLCFYQKWTTGGIFLILAEVTILGSHVLEKTCGNWEKAARVAEKIVSQQQKLLLQENRVVEGLQQVVVERKTDDDTFEGEKEALIESTKELAQRQGEVERQVTRYAEENTRQKQTITEYQATVSEQARTIELFKEEQAAYTEQGNLMRAELTKIRGVATTLETADQRIAAQATATSAELQQGLAAFAANVKEMRIITQIVQEMAGQNQQLQSQVGQLSGQVQTFEQVQQQLKEKLQSTMAIYQSATTTCTALSGVGTQIAQAQQAIKESEDVMSSALTRFEQLVTNQHARTLSRTDLQLTGGSSS